MGLHDISRTSIEQGRASIFVNKELQRVNRDALEKLDDKGVIMKFPAALSSTSTRLVLKEPKTKTSIRKVFLPKTVAEMLFARKKEIEELKNSLDQSLQIISLYSAPQTADRWRGR